MEATPCRQRAHADIRDACISLDTCLRQTIGPDCLESQKTIVRLVGELREVLPFTDKRLVEHTLCTHCWTQSIRHLERRS